MHLLQGSVVISEAGHDKGSLFVAVNSKDGYIYICDGKERKLEKPKRKNIKHIRLTDQTIDLNEITNKKLRKLLREIGRKVNNCSHESQHFKS